ncbi:MAG: mannose-1-phosphate guanylyltransferase/mannose-6-phosphate isomerase [Actinobacteria bacterium]|nr:mannose-1-phosphate guanylyltransferase/mannose-6-phosphate isomerase [Actinomycetota bacterium]
MKKIEERKSIENFYAVVLAGGAGTRLWPLSRELTPKQLLKLFGADSLIRKTVSRLKRIIPEERVYIVTSKSLFDEIRNHLLSEYPPLKKLGYILEPLPKNTAPAVILAAWEIKKIDNQAVIGVFPSDHYIEDDEALVESVLSAIDVAKKGYLVTFGLKPTRPESGFGYIEMGDEIVDGKAYKVKRFIEKPPVEIAEKLIRTGKHFWNSGMFVFSVEKILDEAMKYLPEVVEALKEIDGYAEEEKSMFAEKAFEGLPTISIDYAIMEKSESVAVIPVEIGWRDVGSLPALEEFYEKDERGNVTIGNIVNIDCKNSLFYSDSRLVAGIGLDGLMVIDTRDATLVCPKERAQDVAQVVKRLKDQGREEYISHRHSTRPWGSFTLLEKADNYQVKLIEVKPGAKLSEQMHNHRSENWIVVKGTARVFLNGEERILHAGESIYIPANARHRLENPGKINLTIIEVQIGEYLGEDDIVRFSDDFGRGDK